MNLIDLLIYLLIAGIVGAVAQSIVGFHRGGFLVSVFVGLMGALIGTWLAAQLHMPTVLPLSVGGRTIEVVWSILGAIVFVFFLSLLRGPRWRRL